MAKTVSKETTESAFGTEKDNMQGCYDAIDSCGKGFDKALAKMEGDLTTAQGGIAGWAADDVQVKLDDFLTEEMSPFLTAIKTDISGGSFLSLKNTAKQLITDLDNCKKAKKAWEDAKTTLSKTPKTIKERKANNANWAPSYQGGQNPNNADYGFHEEEKANPDYATAEKAAKDAERTLENYCQTANNHFSELTQFTFKKPNPAGGSGGTGTGGGNQTPPANPEPPADEGDGSGAGDNPNFMGDVPEGAEQFGTDIGGNPQNFFAAESTLGDTNVKVFYDADTGNRVYINPETGEVAMCYRHEDGSIKVMMTTTSDGTKFSNPNDHQGGAEGILEIMRECTRVANEGSPDINRTDLINSQLDTHVNNWNVQGDFQAGQRGGYNGVEGVLGSESWTNPQ